MASEEQSSPDIDVIHNVFKHVKELGRGGQARVMKVRADREHEGFNSFLALSIAWHEVNKHKQIAPIRLKIATINRNIGSLQRDEAEFMDRGDEENAGKIRANITTLQNALLAEVDTLKKRQTQYVQQRSSNISEADTEAMIRHMKKIGLPYPDDDVFAMKMVLLEDDESLKSRLKDEFKSLKLLEHRNILQVYVSGDGYYIEEYIHDIVDPHEVVPQSDREEEQFSNGDRIKHVIEAAKALEHTHLFGVVHRDVKPDNIAVDLNGKVKLIDFGVAKSAESEVVTQTGMAVGTPSFMCPGQIQNPKEVNPSYDVYSLGASLYNFVSGELPYFCARNKYTGKEKEPQSAQDVMLSVVDKNMEPIPPSEIAPGIPRVLELIIQKAMEKEQQRRYQSVTELREDLETFLEKADPACLEAGSFFEIEPAEVDMTIRRRGVRSSRPRREVSQKEKLKNAVISGGVLIILLIVFLAFIGGPEETVSVTEPKTEMKDTKNIQEMYEYAVQYEKEHPKEIPSVIRHFESVLSGARGTVYQMKCEDKLKNLRNRFKEEKEEVLADLQKEADILISKHDYAGALNLYEQYNSDYAEETESERRLKGAEIGQKKRAYEREQTRLEREKINREAAEKRKKEQELFEKKRRQQEQITRLKNRELPRLKKQIAEALKKQEYKSILSEVRTRIDDAVYGPIKEDLMSLEKTIRSVEGFYHGILQYFRTQDGKPISLMKYDRSLEKGICKGLSDGRVLIAKKMIIDGASLETVVKIPVEQIPISTLILLNGIDASDPDIAFAAYIEAEKRENKKEVENYKSSAEKHELFRYLKGDVQVQTAPVPDKPVRQKQNSVFKIHNTGRIDLKNASLGFVHYGKDNERRTIPQNSISIKPDPGYPEAVGNTWKNKGLFQVGGGDFGYEQEVTFTGGDSISYSIKLNHKTGIPTQFLFASLVVPKEFGKGRELRVDNRKYIIQDEFVLPFGVRTKARKVLFPVEGGTLEITDISNGVYFSTLKEEFLLQVHFTRTPAKEIVNTAQFSLHLKYIPDEPLEAEGAETGWVDLLQGKYADPATWKPSPKEVISISGGVLKKVPSADNGVSFGNIIKPKGEFEVDIDFELSGGTASNHHMSFVLWPFEHWAGMGGVTVKSRPSPGKKHNLRVVARDMQAEAFLDGKKHSISSNTLKRGLNNYCEFRIYCAGNVSLTISRMKYRLLSEKVPAEGAGTGLKDVIGGAVPAGAGWTEMLKGHSLAETGWQGSSKAVSLLSFSNGVLTKAKGDETCSIYQRLSFTGDLELEIEFTADFNHHTHGWLSFCLWPYKHWDGAGNSSIGFSAVSGKKHHFKVTAEGKVLKAWLDGTAIPDKIKNKLNGPIVNNSEFRIYIPGGNLFRITKARYRGSE